MLHLRFTRSWEEFAEGDEVVFDPQDGGVFLLRRMTPADGHLETAAQEDAVEILSERCSTAAVRLFLNLPRRPRRSSPPHSLRLVR